MNNQPTICLNMIVKNESKIITRLFNSVLPIIDCYCICDTGSTDNTVEVITNYFLNKGIPGKVVSEPFVDFCHNRNFALNACNGMSDYILLLDADMILQIKNFNKNTLLEGTCFVLLQGNDALQYQNIRIIKNNSKFKYVGVTHEYLDFPNNENIVKNISKNELFIYDYGDGGSKGDKFERDIKLLLNGIKEEPNNERYYFYLANSYHDSGRFGEAINVYKKRIELEGWKEEVWYSYYRIGLCFKNIGKMDDAIKYWMDGYNLYPERLEGLYEIISYYRLISKHNLAYFFYKEAIRYLNMNLNKDNYLFARNDVYSYLLYYEYTIFALYIGNNNINNELIKVLNNNNCNAENYNLLNNFKFYDNKIKPVQILMLDNSAIVNNIKLRSSSSCLIQNKNKDGYQLNIRFVNYTIQPDGSYIDCDNNIITINKYVELSNDFKILAEKWIDTNFDNRLYIGVEDVRIWNTNNNLKFIGTGYHKDDFIGVVYGNYDYNNCKMEINEIKNNFNKTSCEKNWVFFEYKNENNIIYKWNPLQICKINEEKNILNLIEERKMPKIFSYVRGSSCGFTYKKQLIQNNNNINDNITLSIEEKEIWFITHIVSPEQPRHYYHLIAVFDENMNLLRYSAPFKFEGEPIEYSLSIVVEDKKVLINYSTWDRTTRIGIYDKKYIDSIVKYT